MSKPTTVEKVERDERDPLLADDLARVLSVELCGLSCDALAERMRRRRRDVLAALRGDERFEHHGRTSASRWRLAARIDGDGIGTERVGFGVPWATLDPSGVPLVARTTESAAA